jgi:hypothetical protein
MCTNQEHPTFICPAHNITMFLDSYQFDITDINYTPIPIEYQCPFGCVFKIGVDAIVQQRKKENVMKTDIDIKID